MDAFRSAYPTVCDLLSGTPFEADATTAVEFAKSEEDLCAALEGRLFALNELMCLLCGVVCPEMANSDAAQLETDLATIVGTVGLAAARNAFKEKFLVEAKSKIKDPTAKIQDTKNKLEDVRYEIAVTAKACTILDAGSIQLEKPIPNPNVKECDWKNSDVYGTFLGQPVRIEVTVMHEKLPPAIHMELDEYVRQTDVSSGIRIVLRSVLVDKGYAERVRALIELLHDYHLSTKGSDVEIDGVRFEWMQGAYHCSQKTSPFESLCFYEAEEFNGAETLREIIHPCSVRPVTSPHVLEDSPNPPGVVTVASLPDTQPQVPLSTKVGQMLGGKLQQCEDGVLNLVAFGNPLQKNDSEVVNAVCGSVYVGVRTWTDKNGVRHSGKGVLKRDHKAPFVPAQYVANYDDYAQFIKPFRKMSAVWHIRLGWQATSYVIPNPNASVHILRDLIEAFSGPSPSLPKLTESQRDESTCTSEQTDNCDKEIDIIWSEVAENYVQVCGSITEAKSVLAQLEQTKLTLDEIIKKVEQYWSKPMEKNKDTKFICPTNEEMAMTFIVDCGGYEQAKACLDEYAKEIQGAKRL